MILYTRARAQRRHYSGIIFIKLNYLNIEFNPNAENLTQI